MVGNKMNNAGEIAAKVMLLICALISIAAVLAICFFIFINGFPAMQKIGISKFLLGSRWKPSLDKYGIFPMIIGSIYITGGAAAVGVPLGILTAVCLTVYCRGTLYKAVKSAINFLAGIPSVVFGFFGLSVIVPAVRRIFGVSGKGIFTASVVLGIMILPTVVSICESSLAAVPKGYLEGSLALGATTERSVFKVLLPAAGSGVVSSVILGIGRAIGETMAVVLIAGNQAVMPKSVFSGVRTLTANIVLEMSYASQLQRGALIATAVVLFVFILIINLCFAAVKGCRT